MSKRGSYEILIKVGHYIENLDLDDFKSIREVSVVTGVTWRSAKEALRALNELGLATYRIEEGKSRKKYGRAWC